MEGNNIKKIALVTGATGGIGVAICRRLAFDGFDIFAQYFKNQDRADELKRIIENEGVTCHLVQSDLRTEEGVSVLVAAVGGLLFTNDDADLTVLVNNAAKLIGPSFPDATPVQFDEYFSLNTKAPFFLTQQLSTRMAAGSSIVNISSAGAHFSSPGDIIYAMSKAAIESLTINAAEALAGKGIRINTVVPGFTDNGHPAFKLPEVQEYMSSFSVLGGVGQPKTVADAVAFLASDKSSRTTGATLDVSGGSLLGARPAGGLSLRSLI